MIGKLWKTPTAFARIAISPQGEVGMREERQFGFADCEQSMVRKRTGRESFLAEMEEVAS